MLTSVWSVNLISQTSLMRTFSWKTHTYNFRWYSLHGWSLTTRPSQPPPWRSAFRATPSRTRKSSEVGDLFCPTPRGRIRADGGQCHGVTGWAPRRGPCPHPGGCLGRRDGRPLGRAWEAEGGRAQNSSSAPPKSINSWCSRPQVWECDGPSSGDAERFSRRGSPETQPKVYSPKFR